MIWQGCSRSVRPLITGTVAWSGHLLHLGVGEGADHDSVHVAESTLAVSCSDSHGPSGCPGRTGRARARRAGSCPPRRRPASGSSSSGRSWPGSARQGKCPPTLPGLELTGPATRTPRSRLPRVIGNGYEMAFRHGQIWVEGSVSSFHRSRPVPGWADRQGIMHPRIVGKPGHRHPHRGGPRPSPSHLEDVPSQVLVVDDFFRRSRTNGRIHHDAVLALLRELEQHLLQTASS